MPSYDKRDFAYRFPQTHSDAHRNQQTEANNDAQDVKELKRMAKDRREDTFNREAEDLLFALFEKIEELGSPPLLDRLDFGTLDVRSLIRRTM